MTVLRDGLLDGRVVALAGGDSVALRGALEGLGARVEMVPSLPGDEERVGEWARGVEPLHAVVYDAREAFGSGGADALAVALEGGWVAVREVANGALIEAGQPGKVVLIGPRPDSVRTPRLPAPDSRTWYARCRSSGRALR